MRPKVVASTATVRQAEAQAHALFLRGLRLFPPPGLDAGDSFFALQRGTSTEPGRGYLGICAHGRRLKAVLIRVYVALLAAAQTLYAKYGGAAAVDPYMTLLGYFNSMRELGGMRRLVEDDVATRLDRIDQRGLTRRSLRGDGVQELTSRLSSADIPRVLDRLSVRFRPDRPKGGPYPIDVLLATNMVSVGVDVPRLGLMVVTGQPKATAEYIQATSRVGREHPGLVVTVYHWARLRDLSHYEAFEHYHATFYREVEALSVTPFAARAMDRGLAALLAGLVRLQGPEWNANTAAGRLDRNAPQVVEAVAAIRERAALVASDQEAGEQAGAMLASLLDEWAAEAAKPGRTLTYKARSGRGDTVPLLREPVSHGWPRWTCPQGLRNVESSVGLLLVEGDLGGSAAPPFEPAAEAPAASAATAPAGSGQATGEAPGTGASGAAAGTPGGPGGAPGGGPGDPDAGLGRRSGGPGGGAGGPGGAW